MSQSSVTNVLERLDQIPTPDSFQGKAAYCFTQNAKVPALFDLLIISYPFPYTGASMD